METNQENRLLTVKEFAEIAGVSVQSVYKRLNNQLSTFVKLVDNRKMLEYRALREIYGIDIKPKLNEVEQPIQPFVKPDLMEKTINLLEKQNEQLSKELEIKNKQIEELNNRLAECQTLLNQQQQLNVISEKRCIEISEGIENKSVKTNIWSFWKKNK